VSRSSTEFSRLTYSAAAWVPKVVVPARIMTALRRKSRNQTDQGVVFRPVATQHG
jgi:hypothetical protein